MKTILLLVDNFTPDLGAASFRFESVVKKLTEEGVKVKVLCSYPNRIDIKKFKEINLKNLEVIRISEKKSLKANIFLRSLTYFKFLIQSLKVGIKLSKDVDLILASSPQLFVGFSGALLSIINRKFFILDIRDLWPDIVIDMNVMKKYNPIYIILKVLEIIMYKNADFIVYNSPGFKEYLEAKNKNKKMKLITNGIDDYIFDFFKKQESSLNYKDKNGKYKLMYAGNLGIAQDIILLSDLALKYPDELEIILIGKGSQEDIIKNKLKEMDIKNIKIIDSIPRKELLEKYLEIDILFLQLKNIKMFEKTIPSKIFEYMASTKPIIYGLEGIGKKILQEDFEQKYYFKCNNITELCKVYESVKVDLNEKKIKKIDLKKLKNSYSREKLSEDYKNIIMQLIGDNNENKNFF